MSELIYYDGLEGANASLPDFEQVNVRGYDGVYLVYKVYPLLASENGFINLYLLQLAKNRALGLFAPEQFISKASEKVPDNEIPSVSHYSQFLGFNKSLNGSHSSFKDGRFVKIKGNDKIYKVVSSCFMLNSDNIFTVFYQLYGLDDKTILFCPQSFLVEVPAPDNIEVKIVVPEVSENFV